MSDLVWTTEAPTEAGHYMVRCPLSVGIVYCDGSGRYIWVSDEDITYTLDDADSYAGPIDMPREPEPEIVVTDAMIRAGFMAQGLGACSAKTITAIYIAMERARDR